IGHAAGHVRTAHAPARRHPGGAAQPPQSRPRELAPAPPAGHRRPPEATAAAPDLGQAALARRPPVLRRLAPAPGPGHPRHGGPMAPAGLASAPALAVTLAGWTPAPQQRDAGPDPPDVAGESTLGRRADPRRAAQARDRGEQPLDPALPRAWTGP